MALDEAISRSVIEKKALPTIRFYTWRTPGITLGSFQKLNGIDTGFIGKKGIPVGKRPTGGRAILHGYELTYSVASPYEGLFKGDLFHCYTVISRAFESAFRGLGLSIEKTTRREKPRSAGNSPVCFQALSFAEIGVNGKKIIGSAQKRYRGGFLQQGSVPYSVDVELHKNIFRDYVPGAMAGLAELVTDFNPSFFKDLLKASFEKELGIRLLPGALTPEELLLAEDMLPSFRILLP